MLSSFHRFAEWQKRDLTLIRKISKIKFKGKASPIGASWIQFCDFKFAIIRLFEFCHTSISINIQKSPKSNSSNPPYRKRWRLVYLPIILKTQNPKNAHKKMQRKVLKTLNLAYTIWLVMCLLAVLGPQSFVIKCTAAIFFCKVDWEIRGSSWNLCIKKHSTSITSPSWVTLTVNSRKKWPRVLCMCLK